MQTQQATASRAALTACSASLALCSNPRCVLHMGKPGLCCSVHPLVIGISGKQVKTCNSHQQFTICSAACIAYGKERLKCPFIIYPFLLLFVICSNTF